jgi:primosomal protein N' (replication factor Y)
VAQAFLNQANAQLQSALDMSANDSAALAEVSVYPAVPMSIQRVANVERAQMLIESPSRKALHRVLELLQEQLHASRSLPEHKGLIRWLVDVDPLAI